MPLVTYQDVRPWAKVIRAAVLQKKMPPWFADPRYSGAYTGMCADGRAGRCGLRDVLPAQERCPKA